MATEVLVTKSPTDYQ